jgi:hypothetical protein
MKENNEGLNWKIKLTKKMIKKNSKKKGPNWIKN